MGQGNLAYGMILDVFKPQNAKTLDAATTQFLESLRKSNPDMKIVRQRVQTRLDGRVAQLTEATNTSAAGGQETNIILTVLRPEQDGGALAVGQAAGDSGTLAARVLSGTEGPRSGTVKALTGRGEPLGEAAYAIPKDAREIKVQFDLPLEIRNQVARIARPRRVRRGR